MLGLQANSHSALRRDGAIQISERFLLAAVLVEVCRSKPLFKVALANGPFGNEHRIPPGIAILAFDDHVLAENALKRKSETQGRSPRRLIQRVALPFVAAI